MNKGFTGKLIICGAILVMTAIMLSGCGKGDSQSDKSSSVANVITPSPGDKPVEKEGNTGEKTSINTFKSETEKENARRAEEIKKVYISFMEGREKASMEKSSGFFDKDKEYTIDEIFEVYAEENEFEGVPERKTELSYGFLDCGLDGIPELAVCMKFERSDGWDSVFSIYQIFRYNDGKIEYVIDAVDYYRTSTTLNSAGYYSCGGSSGAASYGVDYYFVDKNGENTLIHSVSVESGMAEPAIPLFYLPGSVQKYFDENKQAEDQEDTFSVEVYNFDELDYSTADIETAVENYRKQQIYVFVDEEGHDVSPSEELMKKYSEYGIKCCSVNEIETMLQEKKNKIGFTEAMQDADPIEWIEKWNITMEKESPEGQIKTIAEVRDKWLLALSEIPENTEVLYAVSDMNRNGRLEVIRSMKNLENSFCENDFWEISEDYKEINKMKYNFTDTVANFGEIVWSPNFVDNSAVYCFRNDGYKEETEYQKPVYYYVFPTACDEDCGIIEKLCTVGVDNSGSLFAVRSAGCTKYNATANRISYEDENGNSISEEEYQVAAFGRFPKEAGWSCDKVTFGFVSVEDDIHIESRMRESFREHQITEYYIKSE